MKETYKQRVLRFYHSERKDNNPALQAMRSAQYEAKYGEEWELSKANPVW